MTKSWNIRSFTTQQRRVGDSITSPGPLGLASGPPSSAPGPNREPRLAGVLPAAGQGLAGWSHQPVARRRPTGPPFPYSPDLLKDSDSPGGGATSRGWSVARRQNRFLQLSHCPLSKIVSIALWDTFIPGEDARGRLLGTPLPTPLSGRVGLSPSRRPRPRRSEGGRCGAEDDAAEDQPMVPRDLRCLGDRSPLPVFLPGPPAPAGSVPRGPFLNPQDFSASLGVVSPAPLLPEPRPSSQAGCHLHCWELIPCSLLPRGQSPSSSLFATKPFTVWPDAHSS